MSSFADRRKAFFNFIWNSDEKEFLGRGGRSWAEIGLFYLIYYSCLAGFFVGMLAIFYQTVDETRPKLTGTDSLLKGNPGMGFQPMPDVEYTLVRFRVQEKSYMPHVDSIKKVLKPYLEAQVKYEKLPVGERLDCEQQAPAANQSCPVDVPLLTKHCNVNNSFGYDPDINKPCVLLRLNKIFDWVPQVYNKETIKGSSASDELKEKILKNPEMIYVECVGENPADRDNIGEIEYYPQQGFPHYYYPFTNQKEYMAPVVFVRFVNPPKNLALMIECRALAPNIHYDRTEKEGGVHFELLVDP